jgi:hypothetical protein
MTNPDNSPDDPTDEMLLATLPSEPDNVLRTTVLTQTLGVMRRRRLLKRCALAASLLCCYLAGILTAFSPLLPGEGPGVRAATSLKPRSTTIRPAAAGVAQVPSAPPSGFESWRRIGDHYLRDSDDISLAITGYSRALDLATDRDLAISPGQDNWLLMALKAARIKERKNANYEQN